MNDRGGEKGGRGRGGRRGEIIFELDSEERQTKHVYHNVNNTQCQPPSLDRRNNSIISKMTLIDISPAEAKAPREESFGSDL